MTESGRRQWLQPLMPMSCRHFGSSNNLPNLIELKITGDFSHRTDLFYDVLKSSPNLESITFAKYDPANDDLFGTWLAEIVLSCDFPSLRSLEIDCTWIHQQVEALLTKRYALRRLSIDLDVTSVVNNSIDRIIKHFRFLESVEFGVDEVPCYVVYDVLSRFKNMKCWVAKHHQNVVT
jgi:hypothetical protein